MKKRDSSFGSASFSMIQFFRPSASCSSDSSAPWRWTSGSTTRPTKSGSTLIEASIASAFSR